MLSWIMKWKEKKRLKEEESIVKQEVEYIKRLAHKYLIETEGYQDEHPTRIKTNSLRRMCKYILKTRPKIKQQKNG